MNLYAIHPESALLDGIAVDLPAASRALAIAPHPDDEVFGCGGTLALLAERGCRVRAVIVTDGEAGLPAASDAPQRLAESEQAAEILGCVPPLFLHLPDRGLQTRSLVEPIARAIEDEGADLVFLPSPLEIHPDHQAVALAGLAALALVRKPCRPLFYEISQPLSEPTHLIDIGTTCSRKTQAAACFATQMAQLPYDERIIGLNRFRAYHLGPQAVAAEAFVSPPDNGEALMRFFAPALRLRHMVLENRHLVHLNLSLKHQLNAAQGVNAALNEANAALNEANAALNEANAALNEANASLELDVSAYTNSTSWRLTAPLRGLAAWMHRISRGQR